MLATVSDYKILDSEDPTKPPSVVIRFACDDGKARNWYGYFTEKAQKITIDTLLRCGFSGGDPAELAGGVATGLLDTDKELELVVEMETYNGKEREKVRWVNEVGGGGFKNEMLKEDAVKKFAGLNLKAALAERKALAKTKAKPEEDEPW